MKSEFCRRWPPLMMDLRLEIWESPERARFMGSCLRERDICTKSITPALREARLQIREEAILPKVELLRSASSLRTPLKLQSIAACINSNASGCALTRWRSRRY